MLRWLIALALLMHGVGHITFFLAAWTQVPMGYAANPWLLPGEFMVDSAVGKAFGLLWLLAMVGFVGAALGLIGRQPWWPSLAVASAAVSLVVLLPWWNTVDPSTRTWALLADLVVIVAFAFPWRDRVIASLT
jgi:hypothetical protein